ncbi:MAG: hypothetical protein AAFN10_14775, partial [Bacteroidota bacterium]
FFLNQQKKKKEHPNSQTDPEPIDGIVLISKIALALSLIAPLIFAICLSFISIVATGGIALMLFWGSLAVFLLLLMTGTLLGILTLFMINKDGGKDQYIKARRRAIGAIVPFGATFLLLMILWRYLAI